MKIQACAIAAVLLSGCATQQAAMTGTISPQQAVMAAADAAPGAVTATVDLRVNAVGKQTGNTYLNSEPDYRDQRNISVVITPEATAATEALFGGPLASSAMGKHLVVTGPVQRVTIWFFDQHGKATNKYYYQTHLVVSDPAQIRLL